MIEKFRILEVGLSNLSEEGWDAAAETEVENGRYNNSTVFRCLVLSNQLFHDALDRRVGHLRR